MMYGYGIHPAFFGGGFLFLLLLLALGGLALLALDRERKGRGLGCCGHATHEGKDAPAGRDEAVEALRLRYAHGEIKREEYEEALKTLGG